MSATLTELKKQVATLRQKYGALKAEDIFVLWFLRAHATEDERTAKDALTGGPRDKGIDAVLIDDRSKAVFIVQGKFRRSLMKYPEKRPEIMQFAGLSKLLHDADEEFDEFCRNLDPLTKDRLTQARERVVRRGYRLHLRYVTLGKCSAELKRESKRSTRAKPKTSLEIIDGNGVLLLLRDYLEGIAPPVPTLDLPIDGNESVNRYDAKTRIESWVFSVRGDVVASLFEQAGIQIFAKNIRGYLGPRTRVNRAMEDTLRASPDHFWYFNNGVTIVCDDARKVEEEGEIALSISNAQIINGQQTTRSLFEAQRPAKKASLLVRVIKIPRASQHAYDLFVSEIVEGTNFQNAITRADLKSNDPLQRDLEREFNALGYQYLRKRQTRVEAKRSLGSQHRFRVSKEDLAKAVGDCKYKSLSRLEGLQPLFDEHYERIFANHQPRYYLSCFWLTKTVNSAARGSPERQWAKLVALHFLWNDEIGKAIKHHADRFIAACETDAYSVMRPLNRAIDQALRGAIKSYRRHRGAGVDLLELSPYFKREEAHDLFAMYWRGRNNPHRAQYKTAAQRFADELKEAATA